MCQEQIRKRKPGAGRKPLTDEAKQLSEEHRIQMRTMLIENGIKLTVLAANVGMSLEMMSQYKTGKLRITEKRWDQIRNGIEYISASKVIKDYVIDMLNRNGRTIIQRSRITGNEKQYLKHLHVLGYKCELENYGPMDRCYTIRLVRKLANRKGNNE